MWTMILGKLNPYIVQIKLVALALALLGAFALGWKIQGWRWSASETARISEINSRLNETIKLRDALEKRNRELVKSFQESELKRKQTYRSLQDEIAKNTSGRECFGAGAISVWNRAIDSARDMPKGSTGASAAPAGTSATDADILRNALINLEQYAQCRSIHQKIREFDQKEFGRK